MRGIKLKQDLATEYFHAAGNIFQAEAGAYMTELFKFRLRKTLAIVVYANINIIAAYIFREVNEAGVAVLNDIVDELLHHAKSKHFLLGLEALAVIMKPCRSFYNAAAVYLLGKGHW